MSFWKHSSISLSASSSTNKSTASMLRAPLCTIWQIRPVVPTTICAPLLRACTSRWTGVPPTSNLQIQRVRRHYSSDFEEQTTVYLRDSRSKMSDCLDGVFDLSGDLSGGGDDHFLHVIWLQIKIFNGQNREHERLASSWLCLHQHIWKMHV